jgi:RNA polymerase sigma-70 factor, ECF subfamily
MQRTLAELDLDDEVLAARVARADVAAFVVLYERYAPRIHAWAVHALGSQHADDAVQEVFLRLWRNAAQFDPARGRLSAWLFAIARHQIVRDLAARGRDRRVAAADAIDVALAREPDPGATVDEDVSSRERARAVLAALRGIPSEQRRVLVLAYFTGATQAEMASTLGIPLGTVKKRVRLGLQKLRAALANHAEPPQLRIVSER